MNDGRRGDGTRQTMMQHLPRSGQALGAVALCLAAALTRHFNDAAYFSGRLDMMSSVDHVRRHVQAHDVEMMSRRAVFARALINGDESNRIFRIEVSATPQGSQVHIKDITPTPAPRGLTEAESWRRA